VGSRAGLDTEVTKRKTCSCREPNPDLTAHSLVTLLTELSAFFDDDDDDDNNNNNNNNSSSNNNNGRREFLVISIVELFRIIVALTSLLVGVSCGFELEYC